MQIICGGVQVFEQCCEEDGACPTLSQGKVFGLCEAAPNQCDHEGHLMHLSLSSEGLECKFPKALSKLRTLTRLDLTFNQLDGRCTAFTSSRRSPATACLCSPEEGKQYSMSKRHCVGTKACKFACLCLGVRKGNPSWLGAGHPCPPQQADYCTRPTQLGG